MADCDPVGIPEIAERLGVEPRTPHQWVRRGMMPPHSWIVSGNRAWEWSTVLQWAGLSGRIQSETALKEYRSRFGEEARAPRLGGPLAGETRDAIAKAAPKKRRKANTRISRAR